MLLRCRTLGINFQSTLIRRITTSSEEVSKKGEAKAFETIPSVPSIPIFGSIFNSDMKWGQFHHTVLQRTKKLGKIYMDKFFTAKLVVTSSPACAAAMFRAEGKYPTRMSVDMWKYPRQKLGVPLSVFLSDGEDWYRLRRAVDKPLLVPTNLHSYVPGLNGIATDVIKFMLEMQNKSSSQSHVPNLKEILMKWSTESISYFLYDRRIGCICEAPKGEVMKFVQAIDDIFVTSDKIFILKPNVARILFPFTFRKHNQAWYTAIRIAKEYAEEAIKEKENQVEAEGFLVSLLKNKQLTREEVHSLCVELMGAGVDTTALATLYLLHHLSRNPDKQEKLFEEIRRHMPDPNQPVSVEFLRNSPYLKATFRESSRINPIIFGNIRTLAQDTIMEDFKVPKGTLVNSCDYIMGRDPDYFPNPRNFMPERWLKGSFSDAKPVETTFDRYTTNQFGFGPRMCVGRRLAELEIYTLIANLINRYRLIPADTQEMETLLHSLLVPKFPIKIRLERRL